MFVYLSQVVRSVQHWTAFTPAGSRISVQDFLNWTRCAYFVGLWRTSASFRYVSPLRFLTGVLLCVFVFRLARCDEVLGFYRTLAQVALFRLLLCFCVTVGLRAKVFDPLVQWYGSCRPSYPRPRRRFHCLFVFFTYIFGVV